MNRKAILNSGLGVLQTFNGLSGLLGGYMLIKDPTGENIDLNLDWLQHTPFPNYLIPGVVLLLLIGISNTIGIWVTFMQKSIRARYGLVFGLILMGWILAQVAWIGYQGFLQPLYFSTGLVQAIAAVALMKSTE